MGSLLAVIVLGIVPHFGPVEDRAAVAEINSFYDENGRHIFDQLIFWDWNDEDCRHEVFAWRLHRDCGNLPSGGKMIWLDGSEGMLRSVRFGSFRRTWTQFDPELADREVTPREERKELSRP